MNLSRRSLAHWLAHPSTLAAAAMLLVGVVVVLLQSSFPTWLFWTGDRVSGTNHEGLVYYRVDGEQYTVDDPRPVPPHDVPVTVYVDPGDPTNALLDRPGVWIDAGFVVVWFAAAAGTLVVAAANRSRHRHRRAAAKPGFGEGLESDWVARHLEHNRGRSRSPDR
jgi:hypothetical protein